MPSQFNLQINTYREITCWWEYVIHCENTMQTQDGNKPLEKDFTDERVEGGGGDLGFVGFSRLKNYFLVKRTPIIFVLLTLFYSVTTW